MDHNPYAPPSETGRPPYDPSFIAVDDDCLVVGSDVTLPARCVLTNQPVDQQQQVDLSWERSFRLVLRRQSCHIEYYVNRNYLRREQYRDLAIKGFYLAVAICLGIYYRELVGLLLIIFVSSVFYSYKRVPIYVVHARYGYFWIGGCGEDFLRGCEQQFGAATDIDDE